MTEYLQVPGGKAVLQRGMPTQILIPRSALKGGGSSAIPAAIILMMLQWIWKYLTSTVDLKQDRILEGIDILKTYMEKAPGFVKKEDIDTEWDTEVNSRAWDAALLTMDTYLHTIDLYNQSQGIRKPGAKPYTIYEDKTKSEEDKSKAGPSDFKRYYSDEKEESEVVFGFAMPLDDIEAIKDDIDNIKSTLEEMKGLIEELKTKQPEEEEESKAPADTSMIEGEFQPASLPADEVNIMDEIRSGFNNIMSALAPQAGGGQADGEGKILTVSLTDENANNISTMIVNKMNEEKALEPAEVDKKGVTNDDLGIEIRDSKRSLQFDINEVKAKLDRLIKLIEEKAMTFNDIYDKLCLRMIREHRNATGRTLKG